MVESQRYGGAPRPGLPWLAAGLDDDHLVSVDTTGRLRLWQVDAAAVGRSLDAWRDAVGSDAADLQLTVQRPQKSGDVSAPKVGKVDPTGNPHVGG